MHPLLLLPFPSHFVAGHPLRFLKSVRSSLFQIHTFKYNLSLDICVLNEDSGLICLIHLAFCGIIRSLSKQKHPLQHQHSIFFFYPSKSNFCFHRVTEKYCLHSSDFYLFQSLQLLSYKVLLCSVFLHCCFTVDWQS